MMNLTEIPGFEGLYSINRYGDVYSSRRSQFLVPKLKNGYYRVRLSKNNKVKPYLVSRLMAATFHKLDLSNSDIDVHHKRGRQMNYEDEICELTRSDHRKIHKQIQT